MAESGSQMSAVPDDVSNTASSSRATSRTDSGQTQSSLESPAIHPFDCDPDLEQRTHQNKSIIAEDASVMVKEDNNESLNFQSPSEPMCSAGDSVEFHDALSSTDFLSTNYSTNDTVAIPDAYLNKSVDGSGAHNSEPIAITDCQVVDGKSGAETEETYRKMIAKGICEKREGETDILEFDLTLMGSESKESEMETGSADIARLSGDQNTTTSLAKSSIASADDSHTAATTVDKNIFDECHNDEIVSTSAVELDPTDQNSFDSPSSTMATDGGGKLPVRRRLSSEEEGDGNGSAPKHRRHRIILRDGWISSDDEETNTMAADGSNGDKAGVKAGEDGAGVNDEPDHDSSSSSASSSSSSDGDDVESDTASTGRVAAGAEVDGGGDGIGDDTTTRSATGRKKEKKKKSKKKRLYDDCANPEDVELAKTVNKIASKPRPNLYIPAILAHRQLGYGKQLNRFVPLISGSSAMVEKFELRSRLEKHSGCVNALNFNQSGTLLASGSDDLRIVIWDWFKTTPTITFESGHSSNVFQTKFLPFSGDSHLVSCARDGNVRLAVISSLGVCRSTKKIAQHRGSAHKLGIQNDSAFTFYSCGEDAVTFQIDTRAQKPTKLVVTRHENRKIPIYSVHTNPSNSHEFCLGGKDTYIRIYDRRRCTDTDHNNVPVKKYSPQSVSNLESSPNVTCAVYNYNGTEVLGTYNDENIYLFDTSHSDGADSIHRYQGHRNNQTVKGVNFYGPCSEFIVSGSDCSNVFIWEKESEQIVNFFHGDDGGVVNCLEPHPHDPVLATSGLDNDIKIWYPSRTSTQHAQQQQPPKSLLKQIRMNIKDRRRDLAMGPSDPLDENTILLFMQYLRSRRRRERREARLTAGHGDSDSESTEDTSSMDDSSDEDSTGGAGGGTGRGSGRGEDSDEDGGGETGRAGRWRRRAPAAVQCSTS